MPVFGAGGQVIAAIELAVRDLGHDLQPLLAPLAIASRSLSRELAGATRTPDGALVPVQLGPVHHLAATS
jgi:hypothetical protein